MKLFVKTKDKKYPIYFSLNSHINIKKILIKNNINPKKLMVVYDKNVPKNIISKFKHTLKEGENIFLGLNVSEKIKNLNTVKIILDILGKNNFNRNDSMICIGGGIAGDICAFAASIYKRGLKFVNIPTTLLSQVDSSIGGKTGINNFSGKNMIGTFCQPNVVITDITFLKSLPKREMICGYAEILKHSIIKDLTFFNWLKKNTHLILSRKSKELIYAIKKSCKIKIYFVKRDVNEKSLRMILNFGHTFAHAIEAKNNYSKKLSHGEAVLTGIILATRLSVIKKVCSVKSLIEIMSIYTNNNLDYTFKNFSNQRKINSLIPFIKNDKKNDDDKINFVLLKKIGKTTTPGKFKIQILDLKNQSKSIFQY